MRNEAPRPYAPRDDMWLVLFCVVGIAVAAVVTAVLELASLLQGDGLVNPAVPALNLATGKTPWGWQHTVAAAAVGLLLVGVGVLAFGVFHRKREESRSIDRKAKLMGDPALLSREVADLASVEGHLTDGTIPPGLRYGTAVLPRQELWTDYRGSTFVVAGPGKFKTVMAVPFCIEAPGALIAMSNKRNLPDRIRLECEERGTWYCFDPMGITDYENGGRPTWWWNPLAAIKGPAEAIVLADLWANANTDPNATKSAFFDSRGPSLLSAELLAAAVVGAQMPQVFRWLAKPEVREPIDILRANGFGEMATFMQGVYDSSGTEKTGLFSTAIQAVEFMVDPRVLQWITDDGHRPEFHPEDFVRSAHDTLMVLSKSGKASASPLTAALMVATTRAAEEYAQTCPFNRIRVPLRIVGDEISNGWKWQELPDKASYYGDLGICLVVFFQNWSQGVKAFGRDGMTILFEACGTRIIGGGLADKAFLADVAALIGEYHLTKRSAQVGRGGTMTTSPDKELILEVADLYAMRKDRMVVLASDEYAVLGEPIRWFTQPYKKRVEASLDRYQPAAGRVPVTI